MKDLSRVLQLSLLYCNEYRLVERNYTYYEYNPFSNLPMCYTCDKYSNEYQICILKESSYSCNEIEKYITQG